MADFTGTILTLQGKNLLTKALTGAELKFTKLQVGDGLWDSSVNPETLTSLISPRLDIAIQSIDIVGDGTVKLRAVLTNSGLTEGFFIRELGIYALDPDLGEILYAVTYAQNPDFLPAQGITTVEEVIDIYTVISNVQNVTAQVDPTIVIATIEDIEKHNTDTNAHQDIRDALQTTASNLSIEIDEKISSHNTDTNAHQDIRTEIEETELTLLQTSMELSSQIYDIRNEITLLQQTDSLKMNISDYDSDKDGIVEKADFALNSDKLDGIEASQFVRNDVDNQINADLEFVSSDKGIILTDRTTGIKYRLIVDNGNLILETV